MKMKIDELESLLKTAAKKFVDQEEAEYFAKWQIDNHIKKFPRINSIKSAISDLESWEKFKDSKIEIQAEKPGSLLYNFNKLGPSLKIKQIHDELEQRAKQNGISMIGINNSNGIHALNLWTDCLANRGLIGLCMFNGGPYGVVPFGGTQGIFGTNPISFSIPTNENPIIFDGATSEIPFFELRNAYEDGSKLKLGSIVDKNGNDTLNPKNSYWNDNGKEVSNLLPMGGGYKGYSIVLLLEILTGSLVRSLLSTEMNPKYTPSQNGGLLIAIDISSFTDLQKFKNSVSEMNNVIRLQKPASFVEKITIPGDRNHEKIEKAMKSREIEIDEKLITRLKSLS